MEHRVTLLREREPKRDSARLTHRAILEATESLILEKGVKKTSLNAIIKRAGVSTQCIYDYFPEGKMDIMIYMMDLRRRRFAHTTRNAVTTLSLSTEMDNLRGVPSHIPIYLVVKVILSAGIQVWMEKPELDTEILRWIMEHSLEAYMQMILDIRDSLEDLVLFAVGDRVQPDTARDFSFILCKTLKGVIEARALGQMELSECVYTWLPIAFSILLTRNHLHPGNCMECKNFRELNHNFPGVRLAEPPTSPITKTNPRVIVEFPTALLQQLQSLPSEQGRIYLHPLGSRPECSAAELPSQSL